jgi:hypothetical protein
VALNAQLRLIFINEVNGTHDKGHFITKLSHGNDPNITAENLSCPTCSTTWAKPAGSTRYTVYVTAANKTCQKIANTRITINRCGIYTPDIFSPNNDEKNDIFFIQANTCVKQITEMVIYNRWGRSFFAQKIFRPLNLRMVKTAPTWKSRWGPVYIPTK